MTFFPLPMPPSYIVGYIDPSCWSKFFTRFLIFYCLCHLILACNCWRGSLVFTYSHLKFPSLLSVACRRSWWNLLWHKFLLLQFLFEAAITNCVELASDRHGCCVLQKCLSQSDGGQRHRLIYEIASNALVLSQDPFGYGNFKCQISFPC